MELLQLVFGLQNRLQKAEYEFVGWMLKRVRAPVTGKELSYNSRPQSQPQKLGEISSSLREE